MAALSDGPSSASLVTVSQHGRGSVASCLVAQYPVSGSLKAARAEMG
jgi:hypothetical protein